MNEFLLVIILGMIVYIPVGVLVVLCIWMHEAAVFQNAIVTFRTRVVPNYLQNPGRRFVAVIGLTIMLAVSPWLMVDYFLLGIVLFVSSLLVLAVIRGLTPIAQHY